MAVGGKDRDARAERERARLYQARRDFHDRQIRRRTRDNLIAGIAGGLLIVGLIASQTVYFVAGPGAPEPTPTPTSTPSPTGSTTPTSPTPSPDSGATPTPTP
ncbi:dioxygenase [Microbacterium sp. HD4P20]|uniref:dioxygenase n=1 Tax=Microbacterium sp. HD4P20 TaxID=2864874 RepID=UPI001C63F314|nr:dioxygenase [Microbacterium sp. HD4P20]MCP2636912.1 dioxygenase [Microbacterium sp. HD4P20]